MIIYFKLSQNGKMTSIDSKNLKVLSTHSVNVDRTEFNVELGFEIDETIVDMKQLKLYHVPFIGLNHRIFPQLYVRLRCHTIQEATSFAKHFNESNQLDNVFISLDMFNNYFDQ